MSVTSARRLAANRANARASTGPRTAAGKARSARNAVRHGLCSAWWADPAVARSIEQVGRRLSGDATGQERELAYAVAAAQVDLARAREAGRKVCAEPRIAAALAMSRFPPGTSAAVAQDEDPEQLEELLCDAVYQLEAIKRYEGHAFSRRERAIRALDARRTGEEPPPRPLPRPRGLRLPRWRLPNPNSRVIRFEGVPRWAWWRPDPLDAGPRRRRAPRRKPVTEVPGELELLVSPALLACPRALAVDMGESNNCSDERTNHTCGSRVCHPVAARTEIERLAETDLASNDSAIAAPEPNVAGVPQNPSETNPPQTPAVTEQTLRESDSPAAPAPDQPLTQQPSETKPRRWGATPTPLPTCRVGPCRWVGEMPADHWSYRGWRYRRLPTQAAGSRLVPQIGPPAWRCPGSPSGRSRGPP